MKRYLTPVLAVLISMSTASPVVAKSLKSCPAAITACGCEVKKSAQHFVVQNALTTTSSTVDCLTIKAAHAVLDLNSFSITGPGAGASNSGVHVLSSATGAYVSGGGFSNVISGFGKGVEIDASHVVIAEINLENNGSYGGLVNGGSDNAFYDLDAAAENSASTSNGIGGIAVLNGSNNLIDDVIADHNGMYGIELNGGTNNAVHDSDGDDNGVYGIWVTGSNGARIVNSTGRSNGQAGLYIGCAPSGAVGGACTTSTVSSNVVVKLGQYETNIGTAAIGIGVDTGNLGEQIGLNLITGNQTIDAVDANASCGSNLWFFDTVTTFSQSCVR